HRALDRDPVAGVEVLIERPLALAEGVLAAVRLNASRFLGEDEEGGLSELANGEDAARDLDVRLFLFQLLRRLAAELRHDFLDGLIGIRPRRIGIESEVDDARELFAANAD